LFGGETRSLRNFETYFVTNWALVTHHGPQEEGKQASPEEEGDRAAGDSV